MEKNRKNESYRHKLKYIHDYNKTHYSNVIVKFRRGKDDPIIAWLNMQPSKNGYIKDLILADMESQEDTCL